jgi:hypothetical protein
MDFTNVKGVTGAENYQINPYGKVYNRKTKRALKGGTHKSGHLCVHLVGDYSDPRTHFIYNLVALAFLPPRPSTSHDVSHKDGNKTNNHFRNLEWVARSEKIKQTFHRGRTAPKGSNHYNHGKKAKYTTRQKQAEAKTGELNPKFKGWYEINGQRYDSASAAGKGVGVTAKTIVNRVNLCMDGYCFVANGSASKFREVPAVSL